MHEDIEQVAAGHGIAVDALRQASELTSRTVGRIRAALRKKFPISQDTPPAIDVVLLGSYGRGEATTGSDRDYLVIVHGQPKAQDPPEFIQAMEQACDEEGMEPPGGEGMFGQLAIGAEL